MVRKEKDFLRGSVTVEASLSLFLFLIFFICMMQFYMVLNLEIRVQSALEQTADSQAAYAAIKDYHDEDGSLSYIQCGLDYVYAKSNVIRLLGKEYLDSSWIKDGSGGLHLEKSNFLKDGETLTLVVSYKIEIPLFVIPKITVVQQTHRRIWIGDDSSEMEESKKSVGNKVYVTKNGSVYHLYADCSYIDVKLRTVSAKSLEYLRNDDGSIYYACESCHPEKNGTVYITSYGNRYHAFKECSAIEREVIQIGEDEIGNRNLCSKCKKRAGG
ncbi:MAG: TadE/TadG family type IV pilus assembly protein [Blautia sp.]